MFFLFTQRKANFEAYNLCQLWFSSLFNFSQFYSKLIIREWRSWISLHKIFLGHKHPNTCSHTCSLSSEIPKTRAWTLSGIFSSHNLTKLMLLLICHPNVVAALDLCSLLLMKIFSSVIIFKKPKSRFLMPNKF